MTEPGKPEKPWKGAPRFGREKPAVPGPGAPRLPLDVKRERKAIQEAVLLGAPKAVERLTAALDSRNEKNAIRAAEILLAHAVPKFEEGVMNVEFGTLTEITDAALIEILRRAIAEGTIAALPTGYGGIGASS